MCQGVFRSNPQPSFRAKSLLASELSSPPFSKRLLSMSCSVRTQEGCWPRAEATCGERGCLSAWVSASLRVSSRGAGAAEPVPLPPHGWTPSRPSHSSLFPLWDWTEEPALPFELGHASPGLSKAPEPGAGGPAQHPGCSGRPGGHEGGS